MHAIRDRRDGHTSGEKGTPGHTSATTPLFDITRVRSLNQIYSGMTRLVL
jgi:hypothetical protein